VRERGEKDIFRVVRLGQLFVEPREFRRALLDALFKLAVESFQIRARLLLGPPATVLRALPRPQ